MIKLSKQFAAVTHGSSRLSHRALCCVVALALSAYILHTLQVVIEVSLPPFNSLKGPLSYSFISARITKALEMS